MYFEYGGFLEGLISLGQTRAFAVTELLPEYRRSGPPPSLPPLPLRVAAQPRLSSALGNAVHLSCSG